MNGRTTEGMKQEGEEGRKEGRNKERTNDGKNE